MADDLTFPSLVSKDRNQNAITNPIYTQLTNGTAVVDVTAGALDVNIDNASIAVTATDLDIRALDHVTIGDSVRVGDGTEIIEVNANGSIDVETPFNVDSAAGGTDAVFPAGAIRDDTLSALTPVEGDYVNLRTDSTGALWVTQAAGASDPSNVVADDSAFTVGTGTVGVIGALADETTSDSVDEGDVGVPRMTLDRKLIQEIADADTDARRLNLAEEDVASAGSDTGIASMAVRDDALTTLTPADNDYTFLRVDSTGRLWVVDDDLDAANDNVAISDGTDTLAVNTDGSINVNIISAAVGGEVHNFDEEVDLASDTGNTHTYTATGGTFLWKSAEWAGAGNVKAEMQNNATTFMVGFLTGRQGDSKQVFFDPPVEVANTQTAGIVRTNRQGQATNVYSTIIGIQL